jgi:hypothetical protein
MIRPVWYSGDSAESCPLQHMAQRSAELGRAPDAFGVYTDNGDGTQTHVIDCPTLAEAEHEARR